LVQPGAGESAATTRYRERHRAARHRAFLDTARRIVTTEGQSALTMQRVTDELGTSVGGIYLYFPTKDALLAELENEALQVLHASFLLGQARLEATLSPQGLAPAEVALTKAMAAARFWIDAEATLPTEIELSRRLFGEAGPVVGEGASARVLPSVVRLLDEVQGPLSAAASLGIIDQDDDLERAVLIVSSVNGVLLASKVGVWDEALFDGRRLALRLVDLLFAGWGAPAEPRAAAGARLDALADRGHLAPVPGPEPPDHHR
jgi:AcrR family transcriptional regulator